MQAPPRVAIVGAGPSGFYAAEAVFELGLDAEVSMIDRLPSPYGLVRSGVAPDHPNLKKPIATYDGIARMPGFRYFGNVDAGRDVSVDELLATHHAVVLCYGAARDAPLGIAGEGLPGSHAATEFVGWYNGHPDYTDCRFDLAQESVAIIGHGNVALDVARILLHGVDALRKTDIAEHALAALAVSRVREIRIIGRRGPAQAKFTPRELEEIGALPAADVRVSPADLVLNAASREEAGARAAVNVKKNLAVFARYALAGGGGPVACYFNFLESPIELRGDGKVELLRLAKNQLDGPAQGQRAVPAGPTRDIDCGLVFRAAGYRGQALPGAPFDSARGVVHSAAGRVLRDGAPVAGLYAAGWVKRGPTGLIGTNRACSVETVDSLGADIGALVAGAPRAGADGLAGMLASRGVTWVDYPGWQRADAEEVRAGQAGGRPRRKFTRIDDMLRAARA